MNKFKVSILVPVYGVEKYIERCAHSLFLQSFKDIEFIFVDDCTMDESIVRLKEVISEYPACIDKVQIIKHKKNKGVGAARKTAINAATGIYILYVDSDDYIEPNMVELLYNKAIEVDADMVFCSFLNEYSDKKSIEFRIRPTNNKVKLIQNTFSNPSFWNKMFKRDLILKNHLEIHEGINYGEDLVVIPQLIYYSNTFAFVEKPLYHYIHYNVNSYTSEFSDENLNQTLMVIQLLTDFFIDKEVYYKDGILLLKAIRKAKILRSGRTEKQYVDLYPEINSNIKLLDIDYKTKIVLLLAAHKQYFLLKIFVKILTNRRNNYLKINSL